MKDFEDFTNTVFNFESSSFFDMPSAARTLFGLKRAFNTFTLHTAASSYIGFDHSHEVLTIAINCNQTNINNIENQEGLTRNTFEISMAQNMIEFLLPKWENVSLKDAVVYGLTYFDELEFKDEAFKFIGDQELEQGVISLYSDLAAFEEHDISYLPTNGLHREIDKHRDPLQYQKVDQMKSVNTIFISYQGTPS